MPYPMAPLGVPRTGKPAAAAALFALIALRDITFLVAVSIWQMERQTIGTNAEFPLAFVQEPVLNAALAASGAVCAAFAAICASTRTRHFLGLAAGAAAAAFCVTPGLFGGFGVAGVVMCAIGLLLVWFSRAEFKPSFDPGSSWAPAAAP